MAQEEYVTELLNLINSFDGLKGRSWGESLPGVIEVYQENHSKYTAIEILCDKYNIDYKNTIAFGDDVNDVDMLKNVKHGYAMKNSTSFARNATKNMTKYTNEEDGVAKTLVEFFDLDESLFE